MAKSFYVQKQRPKRDNKMIKLLVIADDFTGAMDTGVQFNTKGALIRAVSKGQIDPFKKQIPISRS